VLCRLQAIEFLTNHTHVLVCLSRDPQMRLRDIAECVGITERAAHRIIAELEEGGYITRERKGRRNLYRFHPDAVMRHPNLQNSLLGDLTLGELVAPLIDPRGLNGKAGTSPNGTAKVAAGRGSGH
jgi:DNA-binding MarR family transcriptional regulator